MTTKTLTIAFKGDAGDLNSALTAVNSNLGSIGLTATSVKTALDTVGDKFNAQLVVASNNLLKLKIAATTISESLKEATTSISNPTISKVETPQADKNRLSRELKRATTEALKAEQERRITLTREGLARAELLQRESIAREIAIQQEGANSITAIKLAQAVKERELYEKQAREVARANEGFINGTSSWLQAAAQRNAAINSTTAAILRLNERTREQIALSNEANAAPQRRIDARNNAAETYRNDTTSIIAEQERRLALEQAIRVHGADSLRVIELRSSQEQLAIRQRTATQMEQIERNIANGVISRQRANDLRSTILSQQEAALRANQVHYEGLTQAINANAAAHRSANAVVAETTTRSRNLFVHIGEIIGIYRLYTAAIVGVQAALKAVPAAGLERQATEASLLGIFGTEEGIKNLNFVHDIAIEAGQSLLTLEQAYRRYAPSAILAGAKQEEVNKSFRDFAEVGTILHLPEDKINSLFLALDQMYAKGVVQSEEVKKQLGNVLPGAVEVFAQAMGKTPAAFMAAMKANEVIAKDAVPKFAAYYRQIFGGPDDSVFNLIKDRLQSNLNRLETAYTDLNRKIFESSKDAMNKVVKASADMVNSVTENLTGITQGVILLAEALTLRLAGAAFVGVIANFSLLATKVSALTTLLLGIPAIPAAVVASVVYLYGKLNDLSTAYDKATGFTVQFQDQQVSLTNYIKAFAIVALDELKEAMEAFSSSSVGKFGTEAGEAIKSGFVASIELATDSVYKLIAAYETLNSRQGGEQISGLSMVDDFKKNLDTLRNSSSAITEIGTEAEKAQHQVIKLAASFDQEELLASINGLSATRVSELLAAGKLDAINYKAGWEQGIEGLGTSTFKSIKDDLNGTSFLQIPLEANQAYGKMFDSITAKAEESSAILNKALAGSLDIPAKENATIVEDSIVSQTDKLSKIYEGANKILKEQSDKLKADSDAVVYKLEIARNNYETLVKQSVLQKNPISEEEVANKLASIDRQIISEKKKLEEELIALNREHLALQEKSAEKQYTDLEKALQVIQKIESVGDKRAVSPKGALGLMQVQPSTLAKPGYGIEPIDVPKNILDLETKVREMHQELTKNDKKVLADYAEANVEVFAAFGRDYYRALVKEFKGDLIKAAAAYNFGPSNVKAGKPLPKETRKYLADFKEEYDPRGEQQKLTYQTNIVQSKTQEVNLSKELNKLNNDAVIATSEIVQKRIKLQQQLNIEILESGGNRQEAELLKLSLEYTQRKLELESAGINVSQTLLDLLFKRKREEIIINNLQEKQDKIRTRSQDAYNDSINKTNILVQTGVISQLDAAFQLTAANEARIAAMEQELQKAKEIRDTMQNATDSQKFDQDTKIIAMTNELENLRLKANEVATFFNTEFGSAFDDAFGSFLSGSQTAKEAFKSFAQSVVDDIGKIIARELRLQAIKGVVSLLSSLAGTASGLTSTGAGQFGTSVSGGGEALLAGWANGGVGSSPGLSKVSGSILTKPTYFPGVNVVPLASGGVVAGEKGHEAVLPLKRNSQGKLGVEVSSSGNMGGSITIQNLSVSVVEKEDATSEEQAHLIATMIRSQLKTVVQTELADSTRSGRSLNPTQMAATF